jgi:hypothetical protein
LLDVSQVATGGSIDHKGIAQDYGLAWKGPPANSLLSWVDPRPPSAKPIIDTLRSRLPSGTALAGVLQISAADAHVLVLLNNGTLLAGYMPAMQPYALPPAGTVKGRLSRVSASFGHEGNYVGDSGKSYGGYSLGIDAS